MRARGWAEPAGVRQQWSRILERQGHFVSAESPEADASAPVFNQEAPGVHRFVAGVARVADGSDGPSSSAAVK